MLPYKRFHVFLTFFLDCFSSPPPSPRYLFGLVPIIKVFVDSNFKQNRRGRPKDIDIEGCFEAFTYYLCFFTSV